MRKLPPLVSRALALLALAGGLALAFVAIVQPVLHDYAATRDAIAGKRSELARFRRVAAELPARRARLAALERRQAASEGFLKGANAALVAAQLQARLTALVKAAQGDLKTTQTLPTRNEGSYRRVTIRAHMTLDLAAAQRVLYGLESGLPQLFFDNVDLRTQPSGSWRDRHDDDGATLELRFDVYGYMRGGGKKATRESLASRVRP